MSTPEFYNDGQIKRLFPYCDRPDCLLIGGPADGNEGQVFKAQYPESVIIGVEPNSLMRVFQLTNEFPGFLYPFALWDRKVDIEFVVGSDNRGGSLVNFRESVGQFKKSIVRTITIDEILTDYINCNEVVVWLDIEGSEECAILGADRSMCQRRIKLWNIEVNNTNKERIIETMRSYRYKMVEECDVRHMESGRVISDLIFSL